jgi:hypothetical protein
MARISSKARTECSANSRIFSNDKILCMIDLCIIYERKSIVYQIVAYDPYEHEIKESVHEMLFE